MVVKWAVELGDHWVATMVAMKVHSMAAMMAEPTVGSMALS